MEEQSKEELEQSIKEDLLITLDKFTEKIAIEILNEIKLDSRTYGEVIKKLSRLRVSARYFHQYKHENLFNRIKEMLESEMNELPLTNRSEQLKENLERGEITINQIRIKLGISPLNDELSNVKLTKVN